MRGWCCGSLGGGAGGTVVGDISGSFSKLHQSVSRGSWGSRCASSSETAGQTPRRLANDCPSRRFLLLEHQQETRPTTSPLSQHAWRRSRGTDRAGRAAPPAQAGQQQLVATTTCCADTAKSIRTVHLGPWMFSPRRACRAETLVAHRAAQCRQSASCTSSRCCHGG